MVVVVAGAETRRCRSCDTDKGRDEYQPSRWRRNDNICRACFNARAVALSRERGVAPRVPRDPARRSAYMREWHAQRPDYSRDSDLRRLYGISLADYDAMLAAQGYVCAVCRQPETHVGKGGVVKPLAVDHDHSTGRVRGLLCHRCNCALGYAMESSATLLALADYIVRGGVGLGSVA